MRVVLDANVYLSALISSKGNPARIVGRWLDGAFDVIVSPAIVDEPLRLSAYERIHRKYPQVRESRLEYAALISEQGIWVEPPGKLAVISDDESDNRYLECAVAGGALYIVSGDHHLLQLGGYQGITILPPAAFVAMLETGNL